MSSERGQSAVEVEVRRAAAVHLQARDAATALRHFTDDVIAVSNDRLFSHDSLASDVREFYGILKEVNDATWEDEHVRVVNDDAAVFTARFRYAFTDVDGRRTDLRGVWTALFVRQGGSWRIRVRHESFSESDRPRS